jgi:hypothetical protein
MVPVTLSGANSIGLSYTSLGLTPVRSLRRRVESGARTPATNSSALILSS